MANAAGATPRVPKTSRPGARWLRVGFVLLPAGFLASVVLTLTLRGFWDGSIGVYPSRRGIFLLTVVLVGGLLLNAAGAVAVVEGIRRRLGASRLGAVAIGGAVVAPIWVVVYGIFGLGHYQSITDSSPSNSFAAAEWLVVPPAYAGVVLVVVGLVAGVIWLWRRAT